MSNVADLDISDTLMVDYLYLPKDTEIIGAEYNWIKHCVVLSIVHPDLPDVQDGDSIPHCDAHFKTNEDGNPEFIKFCIK